MSPATTWERGPIPPPGLAGEVHVWRVSLEATADRIARLSRLLSADELARAGRFRFDRDRTRFVAAHGALRGILGFCRDESPAALRFSRGPHGRPELSDEDRTKGLRFSLSHAETIALIAVTRGAAVGVDVESTGRVRPDAALIERVLSPRERSELERLAPNLRGEAFFRCWTRKEAFLKATGDGWSVAPESVEVTLAPGESARLSRWDRDPGAADRWRLFELDPGPGYVAAVATDGRPEQLRTWDWREAE